MQENPLRAIWRKGGAAINGWLSIPSGSTAEVMARLGWDSLTIDMQHGLMGYSEMLAMLQAISTTPTAATVRVTWNEPGAIMRILDAGAHGVICPMVNTRDQAEAFVGACRYAPQGYRSFGPARARVLFGEEYALEANRFVVALAMIETVEALENLEAILDTPGLDGVYIGPADLSISLGLPPRVEFTNPDFMAKLEHVRDACNRRGLIAGVHTGSAEQATEMIGKGFRFVTAQSDMGLLSGAASTVVQAIKGTKTAPAVKPSGVY